MAAPSCSERGIPDMKKNRLLLLLIALMLVIMPALTACGGGSGSDEPEDAAQEEDAAAGETDFLIGSWFAEKSMYNGEEKDSDEVFGGRFYLVFDDDGDCQMCIDQKRAPVKWEYTGDGVTLSGDDTYQITFPDDSKKSMIITINGIETLLTKFEE